MQARLEAAVRAARVDVTPGAIPDRDARHTRPIDP